MLAKSLFQVLESRVASVGHRRPELLAMRGRPFWKLLYASMVDTGRRDLVSNFWRRDLGCVQVFAHRFGLFLLHLLPGPKMPLATKLNPDRASDALTDDPFGTQSH